VYISAVPCPSGVGVGFRVELAADLVADRQLVDFVEVVAETCYTQRATRREACALAEIWPVVPHGVKLSLGSAEGIELDRARRLGALAKELRAAVISEHVAFTRAGGIDIGHLTQLPRTRAAIRTVAQNVARARRVLPDVPLLLENVAWSLQWPDDEMDEATFYHEIVAATGCDLLLDLGNLYANAVNEGRDPRAVLLDYPLDRVGMVHMAGGVWEDGFYFDTHAHAIPQPVMALLAIVLARRDVPVMIERDAQFACAELSRELAEIRAMPRGARRDLESRTATASAGRAVGLAAAQAELAAQLAGLDTAATPFAVRIGIDALDRSRGILQRKRVDDALPLLAHLSRTGRSRPGLSRPGLSACAAEVAATEPDRVRDLATRALAGHLRPARRAGPSDAWRIAEAALCDPELADAAAVDRLLLRARFAGPGADGTLRPRRTPFVGSARLNDGRRVRAIKGLGALATVTMRETATGR